jgi:putative tryptophan/tyrosine transport system substrate-binding protein
MDPKPRIRADGEVRPVMSRRLFLVGGLLLLAGSGISAAQQPRSAHRIGVLAQDLQPGLLDNFRAGLRDFGYTDGKNISIEVRNAEGHNDRLPEMAADLVRRKVDVVLAVNTPAAKAAAAATKTVPIVIMRVADPVQAGLIASLARPGGNITGLAFMPDVLTAKAIEMLRETIPTVSRIAALYRGDNPGAVLSIDETVRRSAVLGLQFLRLPVRDPSEFADAFGEAAAARIEAIVVMDDGAMTKHRREVMDLALQRSLPVVSAYRDFAAAGGLFAAGPNLPALYRRGGYFVDRILKGASPADLPVEQPTKFDIVVNLKTAKALSIVVPPSVLLRADEVIE